MRPGIRAVIVSAVLAFALILTMNLQKTWALSIIRDFIGGAPQPTAIGGGNLVDIFNAAADQWERAILDPFTITLHFGWSPVGGGIHFLNAQGGTPNRETEGTIFFNNDTVVGHFQWFMDPTPTLNEEYLTFTELFQDLGGGVINVGRVYSNAVGDAALFTHFDLLVAALHEIGHALGMSSANNTFIAESADGDIDVTAPLPFAGTKIPLVFNIFGVTSHFDPFILQESVMAGGRGVGERSYLSALDILANAQLSGFTNVNLNLASVPEPTALLLLCTGVVAVALVAKRRF